MINHTDVDDEILLDTKKCFLCNAFILNCISIDVFLFFSSLLLLCFKNLGTFSICSVFVISGIVIQGYISKRLISKLLIKETDDRAEKWLKILDYFVFGNFIVTLLGAYYFS